MAASTSLAAPSPISGADLERAERFAREPFLHEGEKADQTLAAGTPRRRALDSALAEIDSGRSEPSVAWRREFSLMLGLERLLSEDEPRLVDGTELSAHQVDALSGTLIALLAEAQTSARPNGGAEVTQNGRRPNGATVEDPPARPASGGAGTAISPAEGEEEIRGRPAAGPRGGVGG